MPGQNILAWLQTSKNNATLVKGRSGATEAHDTAYMQMCIMVAIPAGAGQTTQGCPVCLRGNWGSCRHRHRKHWRSPNRDDVPHVLCSLVAVGHRLRRVAWKGLPAPPWLPRYVLIAGNIASSTSSCRARSAEAAVTSELLAPQKRRKYPAESISLECHDCLFDLFLPKSPVRTRKMACLTVRLSFPTEDNRLVIRENG